MDEPGSEQNDGRKVAPRPQQTSFDVVAAVEHLAIQAQEMGNQTAARTLLALARIFGAQAGEAWH